MYEKVTAPKARFAKMGVMSRNMKRPASRLAKRYKYDGKIRTAQQWALYCNVTVITFKSRLKRHRIDPHRFPLEWVFRRFS